MVQQGQQTEKDVHAIVVSILYLTFIDTENTIKMPIIATLHCRSLQVLSIGNLTVESVRTHFEEKYKKEIQEDDTLILVRPPLLVCYLLVTTLNFAEIS